MEVLFKVVLICVLLESYVQSATRVQRFSAVANSNGYFYNNIEGKPGTYSFNYDVSDSPTGNNQFRTEERYSNGTVTGEYGYVDAFGAPLRFRYVADSLGYRVYRTNVYGHHSTTVKPLDKVAIEPTESSVVWTLPPRPNKNKNKQKNKNSQQNKIPNYGFGNRRYNLIGPPSLYVQYD